MTEKKPYQKPQLKVLPNASHFAALGACAGLQELKNRMEKCSDHSKLEIIPIIDKLMTELSENGVVDA